MKIFYFFGKSHIKNEFVENTNTSAEALFLELNIFGKKITLKNERIMKLVCGEGGI